MEENIREEVPTQNENSNKTLIAPVPEDTFREQVHSMAMSNYLQVLEDFKKGILHLRDYSGVKIFKSIRRAIRRGHVSIFGDVYPKRPFKNIKAKKGSITYKKRLIYERLKKQRGKATQL